MGLGGMSPWSLVLILVIVLLLFGTKKLRNLGSDLGGAMKGFKKAMNDEGKPEDDSAEAKKVEADEHETVDAANTADAKKETSEQK